jgi:precorrin-2 dehydrogenase/sirohydrochlorin ferrochelatase
MLAVREKGTVWQKIINQEVIILLKAGRIKEAEAKINNAIGCSRT